MAHTPGPWKVRPHDLTEHNVPLKSTCNSETWLAQSWDILGDNTDRSVCTVGWRTDMGAWGPIRDIEEALANRALIEAAPDLLEALEELKCWLRVGDFSTPLERGAKCDTQSYAIQRVEAAIRKAKGGTA